MKKAMALNCAADDGSGQPEPPDDSGVLCIDPTSTREGAFKVFDRVDGAEGQQQNNLVDDNEPDRVNGVEGQQPTNLVDDNEPPVLITVIESSPVRTLEVQMRKKESEFRLRGKTEKDTNTIALKLLHVGADGGKYLPFSFRRDEDSAFLAACLMVEQHKSLWKHVKLIAQLIDLLLINLIPGWKPCGAIDHLVVEDREKSSVGSSSSSIQPIHDASANLNPPAAGIVGASDDRGGGSQVSAISTGGNHDKFPATCMCFPLGHMRTLFRKGSKQLQTPREGQPKKRSH